MALFERPSPDHVFTLLRLGFAARLRWELSDTLLTLDSGTLTRTTSRSAGTIFHFLSNDLPPPAHTNPLPAAKSASVPWSSRTMLAAVLARPTSSADPAFLTLAESPPRLSDTPGVLKVSFPRGASDPFRALIAVQSPGPGGQYLSLANVGSDAASLSATVSKRELFHLEIVPGSLGKGTSPISAGLLPPLTVAHALSHALLELGVRFRLRSVHGRVLRKEGAGEADVVAVVQSGPSTVLAESHDRELVLDAFKMEDASAERCATFLLQDVGSGKALSISAENTRVSYEKTMSTTAAVLVNKDAAEGVNVQFSASRWGFMSVGRVVKRERDRGHGITEEWLMAGRRGRLEVRSHRSKWETFQIEFVRQSYDMAIRELPASDVVDAAGEATRAVVRENVARRVAVMQGKKPLASSNDAAPPKEKPTFNHSAALSGISEEPQASSLSGAKTRRGDDLAPGPSATSGSASKSQQTGAAKAAIASSAATATSALPRHQANRKAARRGKKQRQRAKQSQKGAAKRKVAGASGTPTVPKSVDQTEARQAPSTDTNSIASGKPDKGDKGDKGDKLKSSSSQAAAGSSGPPCAACGRGVEGTYTTALGKNFHPHCFCCGMCRRPMGVGAGQFRERGGVPYCNGCYAANLASRCARCSQPIMDTVTTAMDKTWHKACLTCTICNLPLTQTFWLYADKPNEPRCSRCVTGSEDAGAIRPRGNGKMVNLPGFGSGNKTGAMAPLGGLAGSSGVSGQAQGRARLLAPVMPATTRR